MYVSRAPIIYIEWKKRKKRKENKLIPAEENNIKNNNRQWRRVEIVLTCFHQEK